MCDPPVPYAGGAAGPPVGNLREKRRNRTQSPLRRERLGRGRVGPSCHRAFDRVFNRASDSSYCACRDVPSRGPILWKLEGDCRQGGSHRRRVPPERASVPRSRETTDSYLPKGAIRCVPEGRRGVGVPALIRMHAATLLSVASANMTDPLLEDALSRFFLAPTAPATNHEEWLLRMCTQMMHREANMVRMSYRGGVDPESQGCQTIHSNASCEASAACTPPSTAREKMSSDES